MAEIDGVDPNSSDPLGPNPFEPSNDPLNPYSTADMRDYIMKEISQALQALKSGSLDVSTQLSVIFGHISTFCNNVVGQDAQSQTALTGYTSGASQLQKILNDKTGDPVYDINQYTGKEETDKAKVSPEQALKHEAEYLINNPMTKYQLNDDGKIVTDASGNKVVNPAWKFFNGANSNQNQSLYQSIKSNIEGVMTGLDQKKGDDQWNVTTENSDNPGYGEDGSGGETFNMPMQGDGDSKTYCPIIKNMWDLDAGDYTANPPVPSNPAVLQAVQNATGSLGQSYTSSSSAVQALSKTNTQTLTAAQSNLNKFLQAIISMAKAMVSGQKSQ